MGNLDDQLLGIIKLIQKDYQKYAEPSTANERIAQIKQVFADEIKNAYTRGYNTGWQRSRRLAPDRKLPILEVQLRELADQVKTMYQPLKRYQEQKNSVQKVI